LPFLFKSGHEDHEFYTRYLTRRAKKVLRERACAGVDAADGGARINVGGACAESIENKEKLAAIL
jgi:hypothetical protein